MKAIFDHDKDVLQKADGKLFKKPYKGRDADRFDELRQLLNQAPKI